MVFDEYRRFFGETNGEGGGTKGERTGDYEVRFVASCAGQADAGPVQRADARIFAAHSGSSHSIWTLCGLRQAEMI